MRETGYLHFQGKGIFCLEDEGSVLSEICVPIYKSKRRHTPDFNDLKGTVNSRILNLVIYVDSIK